MAEEQKTLNDNNLVGVYLCCAHFMKMVCRDIDHLASNLNQKLLFKDIFAKAILIDNIYKFDVFFTNLFILMKSSVKNTMTINSLKFFKGINEKYSETYSEIPESNRFINKKVPISREQKNERLLKSSPFLKRFLILQKDIQIIIEGPEKNEFYNENFLSLIIDKYVPIFPLWSCLHINNSVLVSNSLDENYFGLLKRNTLESQKYFKCSQLVRKLREEVIALSTECDIKITKNRLTKSIDPTDEKQAQEQKE